MIVNLVNTYSEYMTMTQLIYGICIRAVLMKDCIIRFGEDIVYVIVYHWPHPQHNIVSVRPYIYNAIISPDVRVLMTNRFVNDRERERDICICLHCSIIFIHFFFHFAVCI